MNITLVDPANSPSPDHRSFIFSDIMWAYARALGAMGEHTVHLVGAYRYSPIIDGLTIHSVPLKSWHNRNILGQIAYYRQWQPWIRSAQPDILHSPDYLSLAMLSHSAPNSQLVLTTPGSIQERNATVNPYDRSYTWALEWATRTLRRRQTRILATSEYMAHWWRQTGFSDVVILPLPITTRPATSRDDARRVLGWDPAAVHLLVVANLRPENNVSQAIDWFLRFQSQVSPAHVMLHIIGDGPLLGMVQTMTTSPTIRLYGKVGGDVLPGFYSAASALLMPRRFNATPRVALEALCYGTPIIANQTHSLNGFFPVADAIRQVDFTQAKMPDDLIRWIARHATRQSVLSHTARSLFDATTVAHQLPSLYHYRIGPSQGCHEPRHPLMRS